MVPFYLCEIPMVVKVIGESWMPEDGGIGEMGSYLMDAEFQLLTVKGFVGR